MKMKSGIFTKSGIFAALTVGLLGWMNPASAGTFVESDTDAILASDGSDAVTSVVRLGIDDAFGYRYYSASIGGGYQSVEGQKDEAVISAEVVFTQDFDSGVSLELELEGTYGLDSDSFVVNPQVNVRK